MEDAMPIGTELTRWASKTVDKLDFGAIHEIRAQTEGWDHDQAHEFKQYRDGWLTQKLLHPRSYDQLQVKNPIEKLKMPKFGFTEDQADAIATFVLGLVNDDVHGSKMTPDAEQARMDAGLRGVRQNNCAACHVIDPGTVTFTGEDGLRHSVSGEILALDEDVLPPPMERLDGYVADYEEFFETEVEEYIVRLLATEPGLGDVGDTVVVPREGTEVTAPHGGDFVRVVTQYYLEGLWGYDEEADEDYLLMPDPTGEGAVQDVDGEYRLYTEEPYDKVRWTFAPPVLLDEGGKVQRDWFYAFLNDPVSLRQQMRVRMPSFHWDDGEAGAIVDWFALRSSREWPVRYARSLRHALGLSVDEMAKELGVKPEVVEGLESGSRSHLSANAKTLLAYGAKVGLAAAPSIDPAQAHPDESGEPGAEFSPHPPVDAAHERSLRRDPSYLSQRLASVDDLFGSARQLADKGPNCFQCHFDQGEPPLGGGAQPIAWAPDLYRVHERIREDWAHTWIKNPGKVYPGTAMPANFSSSPPAYQEIYPSSSNEAQIQLILDWLYNMDRTFRTGFRN
jgi:mono/diheme cytochrome c family protein